LGNDLEAKQYLEYLATRKGLSIHLVTLNLLNDSLPHTKHLDQLFAGKNLRKVKLNLDQTTGGLLPALAGCPLKSVPVGLLLYNH